MRHRVVVAIASLVLGVAAVGVVAGCGGGGGGEGISPSDPHVAMGAHLFVQFACSACHGEQGKGGVSPDVPALTDVGQSLTVAQLTRSSTTGSGSREPAEAVYARLGAGDLLEPGDDLVAYIKAGLRK